MFIPVAFPPQFMVVILIKSFFIGLMVEYRLQQLTIGDHQEIESRSPLSADLVSLFIVDVAVVDMSDASRQPLTLLPHLGVRESFDMPIT